MPLEVNALTHVKGELPVFVIKNPSVTLDTFPDALRQAQELIGEAPARVAPGDMPSFKQEDSPVEDSLVLQHLRQQIQNKVDEEIASNLYGVSQSFVGQPATDMSLSNFALSASNALSVGTYNWATPGTGEPRAYIQTGNVRVQAELSPLIGTSFTQTSACLATTEHTYTFNLTGFEPIHVTVPTNYMTGSYSISYSIDGALEGWDTLVSEKPLDRIRREVRKRLSPEEKRKRQYLDAVRSPQEQKARETLREIISETDYRRYITNGFVMVRGGSGRYYQIFADQRNTIVYEKGKAIQSLCIHTVRECPPTDHIINLKCLIEFDEQQVWTGANLRQVNSPSQDSTYSQKGEDTSLVELFRAAKASA